jgi:voltage-gated potassium channel
MTDRRLLFGVAMLVVLTVAGTLGFSFIEGMGLLDALYMTVITLSTVGYREVGPLSDAGRWFTIGLITLGIGAVFYAAGALAGFVIEGRLRDVLGRRGMQRGIDRLENHVIVCGLGRLGRAICDRLEATEVVVVDTDEALQMECENAGHLFLCGSALEESVLSAAGIERARALVAATASDSDNVFIALSARELNPDAEIHARAETSAGVRRLGLSGATQVISPHQLAGERIANALLRPGVVEFLELSGAGTGAEVDLEEVVLSTSSQLDGLHLRALRDRGLHVSVIGLKRGDQPIELHPEPDCILRAGDRIVAVGDRPSLVRLAELARKK